MIASPPKDLFADGELNDENEVKHIVSVHRMEMNTIFIIIFHFFYSKTEEESVIKTPSRKVLPTKAALKQEQQFVSRSLRSYKNY